MFFRIVYCSRNTVDRGAEGRELEQILATARRNNAQAGVTGALLYSRGFFAQVLEGSFDAVQQIFERIQLDERHADVVMLAAENMPERSFADWAMAYAEPRDPVGVNATLSDALAAGTARSGDSVLRILDQVVRRHEVHHGVPV